MHDIKFWVNSTGATPKFSGEAGVKDVRSFLKLPEHTPVTQKQFDQYFAKLSEQVHNEEEHKLWLEWSRLHPLTNALFRVQARIRRLPGGDEENEVTLTTEVKERVVFTKFWNRVHTFVLATNSTLEWEFVEKADSHAYTVDAAGVKVEGTDTYGKDHGKLFRQVGIVWAFAPSILLPDLYNHRRAMSKLVKKYKLDNQWVGVF